MTASKSARHHDARWHSASRRPQAAHVHEHVTLNSAQAWQDMYIQDTDSNAVPQSHLLTSAGDVRRHLTCTAENRFCQLCARNPQKRCSFGNDFAAKHLETQALAAPCNAPIRISFSSGKSRDRSASAEPSSSQASSADLANDNVYLEVRATSSWYLSLHIWSASIGMQQSHCMHSYKGCYIEHALCPPSYSDARVTKGMA